MSFCCGCERDNEVKKKKMIIGIIWYEGEVTEF